MHHYIGLTIIDADTAEDFVPFCKSEETWHLEDGPYGLAEYIHQLSDMSDIESGEDAEALSDLETMKAYQAIDIAFHQARYHQQSGGVVQIAHFGQIITVAWRILTADHIETTQN